MRHSTIKEDALRENIFSGFRDFGKKVGKAFGFGDDQRVLKEFMKMNPDSIYDQGSITFIYDHNRKSVYYAQYPVTHINILDSGAYKKVGNNLEIPYNYQTVPPVGPKVAEILGIKDEKPNRESALRAGFVLGRIGKKEIGMGNTRYPCIGFWSGQHAHIDEAVMALVKMFPNVATDKTVIFQGTTFDNDAKAGIAPYFLRDKTSVNKSAPDEPPDGANCDQAVKFDVDGQSLNISQMLSSLHMVKGSELEKLQKAYCRSVPRIKSQLQNQGCDSTLNLLNHLDSRFKDLKMPCPEGETWNDLLSKAKKTQTLGWKKEFDDAAGRDDDPLAYLTQKELNRRWDRVAKREHRIFPLFSEWLERLALSNS